MTHFIFYMLIKKLVGTIGGSVHVIGLQQWVTFSFNQGVLKLFRRSGDFHKKWIRSHSSLVESHKGLAERHARAAGENSATTQKLLSDNHSHYTQSEDFQYQEAALEVIICLAPLTLFTPESKNITKSVLNLTAM